ncbi:VCBS repeat-containing protein [Larkinella soli]|uniref:VCBS repeat-containing protein n=1 Tax=Larkinella soli TaxID=1770527 RepID=UPI000FFBE813|nr:VCBS repeat-containing protein [Larkinella soli]
MILRFATLLLTLLSLTAGCRKETRFELLDAGESGIDFANTITESDTLNVLAFEYIYNGGGVGVGDVDGDGLSDIFFAGNTVSSRLYLNKGGMKFQDVTIPAGVSTTTWCTGVSMVDLNQDGRLDIYVSTIHPKPTGSVPNLLFINQGNGSDGVPRFQEMAGRAGLADSSYSTQAAFLDYDRDGDLDCYLLTNALESYNRNNVTGPRNDGSARSLDRLYRNDGPAAGKGSLPVFRDVSKQAGIVHEGWGLGVIVNDINQDGWPDVYVANDFQSNDVMYINNQDGTFRNRIADALKHQSHNSMGVDMADINNDGLNEIAVADMLPDDNLRQKTMFSMVNYDRFQMARRLGYQPQYIRNVLQFNRGALPEGSAGAGKEAGRDVPRFSDIGYLAGVAATDWSWSTLFADFDNDGFRDLLITNGYRKDVTNLDFANYNQNASMFGTDETRRKRITDQLKDLEGVYKPKFMYRNDNDGRTSSLTFTDQAAAWGLDQPSYANGTAYADFDNDGDLDLVMNNINDRAFLYRNRTIDGAGEEAGKKAGNYLRIQLRGKPGNLSGLGARVSLFYHDAGRTSLRQYAEQAVQRGYESTVEPVLHFGFGSVAAIDSLKIVWPDGTGQLLVRPGINRMLTLAQAQANPVPTDFLTRRPGPRATRPLFEEVSKISGLAFRHDEDDFVDYKMQQTTLHQKHSQIGPGVAVGDVDGDGLDDLYLAGAARKPGTLFLQKADGTFRRSDLPAKTEEETGVLLFDADNDGDLDLYAASGSTEFGKDSTRYRDRLYKNDGKGRFRPDTLALPPDASSGSCVTAADYDRDGDLDLFVGGRIIPREYPRPARSGLLRNEGGRFTDVTEQVAPGLSRIGLVCAALWTDTDNDDWPDLLLAGEWMPITLFKNNRGQTFNHSATPSFNHSTGWWNSLTAGDFDNDGDMDYVAGNVGLNGRYRASEQQPVSLYANDYDKNGSLDPIMSAYNGGKEYPVHPRETLTDQMPSFRQKFQLFSVYGRSGLQEVLPEPTRAGAIVRRATWFASTYIENQGAGRFALRPLPVEAQLAPGFGMRPIDFDRDGHLDLLMVGNNYASEVLTGWYDAGIGLCLRGDGKGGFVPLPLSRTGFLADGDAKGLAEVALKDGRSLLVVTQNQDSLRAFRHTGHPPGQRVTLRPDDRYALVSLKNGRRRKVEFSWGSTYLSQSTRLFAVPPGAVSLMIVARNGAKRRVAAVP